MGRYTDKALIVKAEQDAIAAKAADYEVALTTLGVLPLPDEEVTDDAE